MLDIPNIGQGNDPYTANGRLIRLVESVDFVNFIQVFDGSAEICGRTCYSAVQHKISIEHTFGSATAQIDDAAGPTFKTVGGSRLCVGVGQCPAAVRSSGYAILEALVARPAAALDARHANFETDEIDLLLRPEGGPESGFSSGGETVPFEAMRKELCTVANGPVSTNNPSMGGRD